MSSLGREFTYYMPTRIRFGADVSRYVGEEVKNLGRKKALVITDEVLAKTGMADKIAKYLQDAKVGNEIFSEVRPNPTIESINGAKVAIEKKGPDVLVAVGGGSSIDTAKLASALAANPGKDLREWEGLGKIERKRAIPLIAIDTAAGTSSEVTIWATAVDPGKKAKVSIGDSSLAPDVALCDPLLTVTCPPQLTAAVGIDALSHAWEAHRAKGAWTLTETHTREAIRLIFNSLRMAVYNGQNYQAREDMFKASILAGMSFPFAGAGMVHGTGERLSGYYDTHHGITMAVMFPYVEAFNLPGCYEKYAEIAKLAGERVDDLSTVEAAKLAIKALCRLIKDLNLPTTLKEVGVKTEDIENMARDAYAFKPNMDVNPRPMRLEDIVSIYRNAYEGELKLD